MTKCYKARLAQSTLEAARSLITENVEPSRISDPSPLSSAESLEEGTAGEKSRKGGGIPIFNKPK